MPATVSTTPLTFVAQIEAQQAALELSDHDLCAAIGFDREVALKLIKAGTMRLPLTKVPALAVALGLDPVELFKQALHDSDPGLAKLIEETFNPMHLTANEVAQIKHQRALSGTAPGAPIVFEGKAVTALVAVKA